ncbi:putative exostosin [Helianthus annuus]|nr:putative exostosin [Helianthus annuus]
MQYAQNYQFFFFVVFFKIFFMGYQYIVMNTPTNIISFYFKDLVNFLTDSMEGRSTLRPADLLVFGWARGKHACVDLNGVSPLVGLRENGFVAGQAARKAESKKVDKHTKAYAENQHVFVHFVFDTFGSLAPAGICLW